ncbi:MAG: GHMP kinase [Armatimonadetes bacterium]|nr:GHMP kinase [Armatimonadota bacterium]
MIISKTPLRISFIGGGSDLEDHYQHSEGKVISSAIDKYIYVIIKERFDDKIYINYSKKEIINAVDEIEHDLVRESMRKTGIKDSIEITTLADIPSEGSGLGSSSTVTVGLLHAFYAYQGEIVTKECLAREACEIEIDILRKPIGKQDQYIAAFGGVNQITFNKDNTVDVEKIELCDEQYRKFGSNILLFYTDKTRKSSEILSEQKKNTKEKLDVLKKMVCLVEPFKQNLLNKNYDKLGELLHQNWNFKKSLASKITNGQIDNMCQTALKAGAIGCKISGAGGGGFMMFYVPRNKQDNVREALKDYRELPFMLDKYGSRIIFDHR